MLVCNYNYNKYTKLHYCTKQKAQRTNPQTKQIFERHNTRQKFKKHAFCTHKRET